MSILALRSLRQEDEEFEASLNYVEISCIKEIEHKRHCIDFIDSFDNQLRMVFYYLISVRANMH